MTSTRTSFIGWMMNVYRRSPLHTPWMGAFLAKVMGLFTAFSKKQVVREINGIKYDLDLSEVIDASLYYSGTFEPKIEKLMADNLSAGMNVIDIGANIGYHTFRMASAVRPGVVYAIEPTSTAYTKLLRNAELNPKIDNIQFIKVGLNDSEAGEQEIAFRGNYRLDGKTELTKERIRLTTLDSVVKERGIERVDFIKLDVDGFEGKVLKGASETLQRFKPRLIAEVTPSEIVKNGDDPVELIRSLVSLGYAFFNEDGTPIGDLQEAAAKLPAGSSVMVLAIPPKA